ncbi:hypothetical protein [Pendulispora albinea]|uniref:Uncharacterized protein n=1 Tax=Pendulispora albinea TaxID=2741071 RepID=A0ABZ2M2K1_9BACT
MAVVDAGSGGVRVHPAEISKSTLPRTGAKTKNRFIVRATVLELQRCFASFRAQKENGTT